MLQEQPGVPQAPDSLDIPEEASIAASVRNLINSDQPVQPWPNNGAAPFEGVTKLNVNVMGDEIRSNLQELLDRLDQDRSNQALYNKVCCAKNIAVSHQLPARLAACLSARLSAFLSVCLSFCAITHDTCCSI